MWLYLVALAGTSGFAASGDEFYDRLFNRGLAQFNEGNYANAYSSLKVAAFGSLEDIRRFQTAEIYMTVAAEKLHRDADARMAAQRVVAAERIERRYASLSLPDTVRKEFEDAARRLLTADQVAVLRTGGSTRTQPQPPTLQPQPKPKTIEITVPPPVIVPAPQQTPKPVPVPRVETPAPQPRAAQPQPRAAQPQPSRTQQPQPQPQPQPAQPQTTRPSTPDPSIADADRAVNSGDLATARTLYRAILDWPQLTHTMALRAAEGLYRSRDFAGAIRAFQRAGSIGTGEEQYHYYYAVALYETGRYGEAKRELHAALPFIEVTADVERYRVKIDGAIE